MLVYYLADARWREAGFAGLLGIKVAGSVGLATLSYGLVERHFLRWKSRLAPMSGAA
jgi:peptidoglycan/LPS O-acetylase OafA/YrhL